MDRNGCSRQGRSSLWQLVLCGFLAAPMAAGAKTNAVARHSSALGANQGTRQLIALRYAQNDAKKFSGIMEELGNVTKSHFVEQPSLKQAREAFVALHADIAADRARGLLTELVVYYSGHADSEGLLLGEERYRYKDLLADAEAAGADVRVLVIDACASGALSRLKGGKVLQSQLSRALGAPLRGFSPAGLGRYQCGLWPRAKSRCPPCGNAGASLEYRR